MNYEWKKIDLIIFIFVSTDEKEKFSAKQGANYTFKPLKKEDDPTG